jgi:cellulose synthase/poly-beta-1,6-N-acetylglucosamine synthase-like glycosyltransferase
VDLNAPTPWVQSATDTVTRALTALPWDTLWITVQVLFVLYFLIFYGSYLVLAVSAYVTLRRDRLTHRMATLPTFDSGLEMAISMLVPAHNEEQTIASSVRSTLQLGYPNFEVIVINDGSKDGTMQVLHEEFALDPFPEAYRAALPCAEIRGIYRSRRFPNLRVIDKANGGKADALNAGINAARHPLFCALDADSLLETDSLRRVVRPFLEDPSTIVSGGMVRLANGCRMSDGVIEAIDMPKSRVAQLQIVEYLRAFLLGRVGWQPVNALLIISGAFGVFRCQSVVEVGGYSVGTIGEDMELIVRLHLHHRDNAKPYRIAFLADPVCWTEAPESLKVLRSQRIRWQRGLLESLWPNRRLMFHRRGGAVGWLAFPAMVMFEALGPALELLGYAGLLLGMLLGGIAWQSAALLWALSVVLGWLVTACALWLDELTFHTYPKVRHLFPLMTAMLLENLGYRHLTLYWRVLGLVKWVRGKPSEWGTMTRISTRPSTPAAQKD